MQRRKDAKIQSRLGETQQQGFTLAESATHIDIAVNPRKCAFTLAEVLITLSIIGVVAALTIPQLVKNMNDYAFGKSRDITLAKITEATNQMKSNDVLSGYATNDAFISEFQKYMKVTKKCDSSTLNDCFPAKFKSGTEDIDTNTLTTGTKLGTNNITGNTVGLMLANGTSILFTLRDSTKVAGACDRIDPTDNQSSTTGCLSFLYDINGFGSPNVIGKDIGAVNAAVTACSGAKVGGTCFSLATRVSTPMTIAECTAAAGSLGITECPYNTDYWARAVSFCGGVNKLPTPAQAGAIADYLVGLTTCGTSDCTGTFNPSNAATLGLPTSGSFSIPTSHLMTNGSPTNNYSTLRWFNTGSGYAGYFGDGRYRSDEYAVCVP